MQAALEAHQRRVEAEVDRADRQARMQAAARYLAEEEDYTQDVFRDPYSYYQPMNVSYPMDAYPPAPRGHTPPYEIPYNAPVPGLELYEVSPEVDLDRLREQV